MANVLKREKQEMALRCLVEGNSIRSTERITGVHRDTIMRLGLRVGKGCEAIMDRYMTDLSCKLIQVDEIWSFVGKKQSRVTKKDDPTMGDTYTFVAIDADTKLVPAYTVGKRNKDTTNEFIETLNSRLANRVQISSDAMGAYAESISESFGYWNVDYAQIVKSYEKDHSEERRYSPPKVVKTDKRIMFGRPDVDEISTSYVERQNLTMRMQMRRFTRLTNAFSKKLDNLKAAIALHFVHYNFVRIHQTLHVTPAMEAGVAQKLWTISDVLDHSAG